MLTVLVELRVASITSCQIGSGIVWAGEALGLETDFKGPFIPW